MVGVGAHWRAFAYTCFMLACVGVRVTALVRVDIRCPALLCVGVRVDSSAIVGSIRSDVVRQQGVSAPLRVDSPTFPSKRGCPHRKT